MKNKDYKVFIVEGEFREPQVIDNISKRFFSHGNYTIITLPAGENIYMLWKRLKADDFETDIIEVLREENAEIRDMLKDLSRDDFSEVYLFFDYDAHQTNLSKTDDKNVIKQMLESFDNETENGKLYISYPMVEALRDFETGICGKVRECFVDVNDLSIYKHISATRSLNPHIREYDIDTWKDIINVFAMKVSCLFGMVDTMNYEQYSNMVNPLQIYNLEEKQGKKIFVLSAFPEFLVDYFGVRLWRTSVKSTSNQLDIFGCRDLDV